MLTKPSLMTRIVAGKLAGFAIGLIGLIFMPRFLPDAGWALRLGGLFWYTTVGAIVAVFGVFTWHPILKVPLPWWLMGPAVGAWLNFVVALLAYDAFAAMVVTASDGALQSPFWFALEGAVIGFVISGIATRFGGEGPETAGH